MRCRKNSILRVPIAILLGMALLLIIPGSIEAEILRGEALVKPWSGHWWPLNLGELVRGYRGHPSPIEKYDLFATGQYPGSATFAAQNEWYDPLAPTWYGFCNGWANASVLEKMPLQPSASRGVFLAVGDKKGLLSSFHAADQIIYEYCYASPEPFHRYLIEYIGQQGQSIVAELDPSAEFWSYPIFKYEMNLVQEENYDAVSCTITYANDQGLGSPDFEGTLEVVKSYQYRLDKDAGGNYVKGGGVWTGASDEDHPDAVWVPVALNHADNFTDYNTILAIVESYDDELEGAALVPGHHQLVVYPQDEDSFQIAPQAGQQVTLRVALDPQSAKGNSALIRIERDQVVITEELLTQELESYVLGSVDGNDQFEIVFAAAENNAAGIFIQLYVNVSSPCEAWFYGFPSSNYWLGIATVSETMDQVTAQIIGDQGLPAGSGLGPVVVEENERLLAALKTDITYDYFSGNQPRAVKLTAAKGATTLVFVGDDNRFWGLTQKPIVGVKRFVLPWLTSRENYSARTELFLANHNAIENHLDIHYYNKSGDFLRDAALELEASNIIKYRKGEYPGNVNVNGWALLFAERDGLDGSVQRSQGLTVKDQLPLLIGGTDWFLPHVAVGSGWTTIVNLYNLNEVAVEVEIEASSGQQKLGVYTVDLLPFENYEFSLAANMWGVDDLDGAWLRLKSTQDVAGFVSYAFGADSSASLPLSAPQLNEVRCLPQVACDEHWWTGVALINQGEMEKRVILSAFDKAGLIVATAELTLAPGEKYSGLATGPFAGVEPEMIASLRLENAVDIGALAIYGTMSGATRISAINW